MFVFFANASHSIVSILYGQSNALLSGTLAEREWIRYTTYRKHLRVSFPKGLQRSAYFISVPWKFGTPLPATIFAPHFVCSQSIFLVVLENLRPDGSVFSLEPTLSYSIWPIITGEVIRSNSRS